MSSLQNSVAHLLARSLAILTAPRGDITWLVDLILLCMIILVYIMVRLRLRTVGTINRLTSLAWSASGIRTFSRSVPKLRMEMASARRYQRPLCLVVLAIEGMEGKLPPYVNGEKRNGSNGNGARSISNAETMQFLFPLMGSVLKDSVRGSDKVTYDVAKDQYIMVFPQTKKPECEQAVLRLKSLLVKRSLRNVRAGIAEFPGDGLILEDLVGAARLACQQQANEESSFAPFAKGEVPSAVPQ
jgi:hypothetical protein